MRPAMPRFLKWTGIGLAVAASALVVYQLGEDQRYSEVFDRLGSHAMAIALLCVAYCVLNLLLCVGWALVCRSYELPLGFVATALLYARTHILRYLPSNLLHFAGRHAALRQQQVAHSTALIINTLEVGLQIIAATALAVALWLLSDNAPWQLTQQETWRVIALCALLAVGASAGLIALRRRGTARLSPLLQASAVYALFFLFSGLFLFLLARVVEAPGSTTLLELLPPLLLTATAAWLAGALVPGASAGIGIRELVLVAGLTHSVGATDALVLALGFRLITVGGDVLLTLAAWLFPDAATPAGFAAPQESTQTTERQQR